jgi:outer membrane protein OmpA-like peptidoglycan-associated protein
MSFGKVLGLSALAGLVLSPICCWKNNAAIGDDLATKSKTVLAEAGLTGWDVKADGVDVTLTGPAADAQKAEAAVTAIPNAVKYITIASGVSNAPETAATPAPEGMPIAEPTMAPPAPEASPEATASPAALPEATPAPEAEATPTPEVKAADQKTLDAAAFSGEVLFATNSAVIESQSKPYLNKIAAVLKDHSGEAVEVSGHTDNQGNDASNQSLSQRRSESVRAYLIKRGAKAEALTPVGYGETQPRETNDTAKGRRRNRRIEFKIK